MLITKLLSVLVVSLLLFPIAKIFYDMTKYQPTPEESSIALEDIPEDLRQEIENQQQEAELAHSAHYELMAEENDHPSEIDDEQLLIQVPDEAKGAMHGFITPENETREFVFYQFETTVSLSPFQWTHRFLQFGPRKWLGIFGLVTTTTTFLLLVFSAFCYRSIPASIDGIDDDGSSHSPLSQTTDDKLGALNFSEVLTATDQLSGLPLNRFKLCDLSIPSGKIITADPLADIDQPPFTKNVPSGNYPVELFQVTTKIGGKRTALAVMTISNEQPVSWPLAVRPGEDITKLKDDEFYGFGVDAGMACIMDKESLDAFNKFFESHYQADPDFNSYDDYFSDRLLANAEPGSMVGHWYHFIIPDSPNHAVAMFSSGYGDGRYPCYWGLDAEGKVTHLVVDFLVVNLSK